MNCLIFDLKILGCVFLHFDKNVRKDSEFIKNDKPVFINF